MPLQLTSGASRKSAVFLIHSGLCHKISGKPTAGLSIEEVKSLCSWPSSDDLLDIVHQIEVSLGGTSLPLATWMCVEYPYTACLY